MKIYVYGKRSNFRFYIYIYYPEIEDRDELLSFWITEGKKRVQEIFDVSNRLSKTYSLELERIYILRYENGLTVRI